MESEENIRIEQLAKLADGTGSAIGSLMVQSSRLMAIGIAVALGVLGTAIKTNAYDLLILLPILIYAMFFHYINLHTSILELGGYKRHVEEELNRRLGEKIFMWETELVPRRHKNVANQFIAGIFLLVLAVSVVLAIFFASQHKYPWVIYVVLPCYVVLTAGLVFSAKNMKKAHEKTYQDARSNFISANN